MQKPKSFRLPNQALQKLRHILFHLSLCLADGLVVAGSTELLVNYGSIQDVIGLATMYALFSMIIYFSIGYK